MDKKDACPLHKYSLYVSSRNSYPAISKKIYWKGKDFKKKRHLKYYTHSEQNEKDKLPIKSPADAFNILLGFGL